MFLATYREPFGLTPVVRHLPEGETLARMVARMPDLPEDFGERGVVCINGTPVGRPLWGMIRPKPGAVTEITMHYPPMGGGGDGGKNVLAIVASIAFMVAGGWIAGGGLISSGLVAPGGLFAAGSVSAYALAAGVSLVGSLLISALIPPPSVQMDDSRAIRNLGAASAQGNTLEPNAPIPRVVGERKVFPPLGMEPFTYFSGPDEVVEAAYILAGPHNLHDIRIGAAEASSLSGVEIETREGWPGDDPLDLIQRQARTEPIQSEMRGHVVDEDGTTLDVVDDDVALSLPQPTVVMTRDRPDEHQLQIMFPQGMHLKADDADDLRVPFRLRMREPGGAWINLPELHFRAASLRQMRATIRFLWRDDATTSPGASTGEGWFEARTASPDQVVDPAGGGWQADPYFWDGAGDTWLTQANILTTGVDHVIMDRYTATIVLDRALFPARFYEIEAVRGMAFRNAQYATASYEVDGSVRALFGYYGTPPRIFQTKKGLVDSVYLLRSVSIWDEPPVPSRDLAVVAVRARNRQLDAVSVVAGGWVRDWDGTGWRDWTITDNPAPHLRDILAGAENPDPVPLGLIDDAELVAWRQHCTTMGYTCNALIEDQTLDDAARIVAACGYARPRMSDTWGVVTDYDRSLESPVQIFTPRNMAGFQWTKGFANVPEGLRVSYRDKARDYALEQVSVFRAGHSDDNGRVEQVTYEGLVEPAEVTLRARYDQAQAVHRNTFYSWRAPAEAIICRRGDLIGLQHDMLSAWSGAGRVVEVETDGNGDVTAVVLDQTVPPGMMLDMLACPDLLAEPDLLSLGQEMGAAIRRQGGAVTVHAISDGLREKIEFSPTIDPADIAPGCLVAFGPLGREFLRLVVIGVTPKEDFEATITAVDEAPQIWEMMNA